MNSAEPDARLFVYGSLLPGEVNHGLLASAAPLGEALTTPEYYLVELRALAALVPGGSLSVRGELFGVDQATLRRIDTQMQHPVLFRRQPIVLANGQTADTYVMTLDQVRGLRRLKTGDWRQRFGTLPAVRQSPWSRWARERFSKP